jgi:hypothetical protein
MSLDRQSALALGCFGKGLTETARVRGPTNAADVGVIRSKDRATIRRTKRPSPGSGSVYFCVGLKYLISNFKYQYCLAYLLSIVFIRSDSGLAPF